MARHTMNPQYGRALSQAEDADREEQGKIRKLTIEPTEGGRFDVECEYANGSHKREELDAAGMRERVSELPGAGSEPKGALGELADLLPDNPKKVSIKLKAKAGGESDDEE